MFHYILLNIIYALYLCMCYFFSTLLHVMMCIMEVKPKIEMLKKSSNIVYDSSYKMEMLVQKLLKSVELFKSYDLLGEPKMVDFLFFNLGKTMTFLDQFFFLI